jgi:hypothetical protein
VRPGGPSEIEHKVDLLAPVAIPFFVRDVLEPVEGGGGCVVNEYVNPPVSLERKIDKGTTVGGIGEIARLHRDDGSTKVPNHLNRVFGRTYFHAASDDRTAFPGKQQRRLSPYASACTSDYAHFFQEMLRHVGYLSARPRPYINTRASEFREH